MLTLFSIVYGPLVVWLTDSFDDKISAAVVLIISGGLIIVHAVKKSPAWIIPFIYLIISLGTLIFGESIWLKFGPLTISLGVSMLLSMRGTAMMQDFIKNQKFFPRIKNNLIGFSAPIWISAAWINVALHIGFLAFASKWLWAFYVSVGWYAVFALGAAACLFLQKRRHD
ncbi:MAG: hypothetical protein LBP54_00500 [Campylobacteraceae bacterium]|jgi:hypothetical protein|nr:hypothetical protein [Campylobacteraceae bacterium]